jgi:hypothetical protein
MFSLYVIQVKVTFFPFTKRYRMKKCNKGQWIFSLHSEWKWVFIFGPILVIRYMEGRVDCNLELDITVY